jgi:hypothetical protein
MNKIKNWIFINIYWKIRLKMWDFEWGKKYKKDEI